MEITMGYNSIDRQSLYTDSRPKYDLVEDAMEVKS